MKRQITQFGKSLIFASTLSMVSYAQNVGINPAGTPPDNSAGLDVNFTNKGLLIPRVALTSATDGATIPSPATSLLVYNTGTGGLAPAGYYYNAGTPGSPNWVRLLPATGTGGAWLINGNAGTSAGTHFVGTTDAQALVFKTNNTERMRILTNGYVGIGTSTPNEKLTVNGFLMINTGANDGGRLIWRGGTGGTQEYRARVNVAGNLGFFPVEVGNPGHVGEVLVLSQSGYVGVGTNYTPNVKLEIYNPINTEFMRMNNGATNPFQIFFGNNAGGVNNPQGVVYFEIGGSETYVFGGHVVPDGHLSRDLGASGHYWQNIYTNDIYLNSCGGWLSSWVCSDERYKENVQPLRSTISKIMQLKPVTYYWKKGEFPDLHFNDRKQIGLIAQEVEKIFPELVNENDKGYKSIDYIKIGPILISAIQEQQQIIENLKRENQELKQKLEQQNQAFYTEIQKIKQHVGMGEAKK